MRKLGNIHKVVDFAERTLSKKGENGETARFTHEVFQFLKSLDETQAANPWVTFTFQSGGGIWVSWNGDRLFYIWPAQQHLRVYIRKSKPALASMVKALDKLQKKKPEMSYVEDVSQSKERTNLDPSRRGWFVQPGDLAIVSNFVAKLKAPSPSMLKGDDRSHPRFFPGEIRQLALAAFEAGGSVCPGVDRKKHKVDLDVERIEFDHILPHSKGGSRSLLNVHVLCQSCNNRKRATARGNAAED